MSGLTCPVQNITVQSSSCPMKNHNGNVQSSSCPMSHPTRFASEEQMNNKMNQIRCEGRYRVFFDIDRQAGQFPHAKNVDNDVTIWCNNDYLGMGQHPEVLKAISDTLLQSGAGAGGTRNISGTSPHHSNLETTLANLHGMERSLVFSSCFVANDSALTALGQALPGCEFYSDSMNHASLIAGIRNSRCKKFIFNHNDPEHLERLIKTEGNPSSPKIIVFESVYSMDGDIAPISEICDVADKHGALTFLDEVHAVGLYGEKGAGVAERDGVMDRISIVSGTLGKAYGCFGGYIAGSDLIIDLVRSTAGGFIFTTALPPYVTAGARRSVEILIESNHLRKQHQAAASMLKKILVQAGFDVLPSSSHIVPLMVNDALKCKMVCDMLLDDYGIYVQPINYPTVPRGTERLRLTPTPLHTYEMMQRLKDSLLEVWERLDIPLLGNQTTEPVMAEEIQTSPITV